MDFFRIAAAQKNFPAVLQDAGFGTELADELHIDDQASGYSAAGFSAAAVSANAVPKVVKHRQRARTNSMIFFIGGSPPSNECDSQTGSEP